VKAPRAFWRWIQFGPRIAYALGLGPIIGRFILLLTTFGRKSGRPRVTPLVYQEKAETYLVAAARGPSSDWLQNLRVNPKVHVRVGARSFDGRAEIVTEPGLIADFLQAQIGRHPRMFGAILRSEGLPPRPTREELEEFGPQRPMVVLRPMDL
jgi:deazaflavin-dependent oxidoreductase (nitroreductase family)